LNLLSEIYGKTNAKKLIPIYLLCETYKIHEASGSPEKWKCGSTIESCTYRKGQRLGAVQMKNIFENLKTFLVKLISHSKVFLFSSLMDFMICCPY